MFLQTVLLASAVTSALGHSWLACSDYRIDESKLKALDTSEILTWNPSRCQGFARNSATYAQKTAFGVDTGYNFIGSGGNYCGGPNARSSSSYTADYPMANWTMGSRVCMAWPAKNHAALSNIFIKDKFTRVYRAASPGTTTDPASASEWTIIADLGPSNYSSTYPGVAAGGFPRTGFQNCPSFGSNSDKALCVNCIDVPTNLQVGVYTMAWGWAFNSENELYTNCFEVNVRSSSGTPASPSPSSSPSAAKAGTSPSPSASVGASKSPSPSASPSTSPPATSTSTATCTYTVAWMGGSGFGGKIACTFSTTPTSWKVTAVWPSGTVVSVAWNSVLTTNGQTTTFSNAAWNGQSKSVEIGFNGQYSSSTSPTSLSASINGGASTRIALTAADYDGELPISAYGEWATEGTSTSSGNAMRGIQSGLAMGAMLVALPIMI